MTKDNLINFLLDIQGTTEMGRTYYDPDFNFNCFFGGEPVRNHLQKGEIFWAYEKRNLKGQYTYDVMELTAKYGECLPTIIDSHNGLIVCFNID